MEIGIDWLTQKTDAVMTLWQVNDVLHSLVIDGIFNGVGSVLSFLPIIVTLFLFLSLLNAGIGHIEETAGIGESGNCVLCGHNGSRYGTFFTPLSQISIGDEVMITDKNGQKHIYEVTETDVVNPYDNSIKTQGDEKELTLFTCSQKGTMRFVVRCIYKEAEMDE